MRRVKSVFFPTKHFLNILNQALFIVMLTSVWSCSLNIPLYRVKVYTPSCYYPVWLCLNEVAKTKRSDWPNRLLGYWSDDFMLGMKILPEQHKQSMLCLCYQKWQLQTWIRQTASKTQIIDETLDWIYLSTGKKTKHNCQWESFF